MISPQQGHIDVGLSNISVMYTNGEFVADQVFQPIPSDKQTDKYWGWDTSVFRSNNDAVAPAGLSNQAEFGLAPAGPFYCEGHALHDWIPDESEGNQDIPIDLQADTTIQLTEALMLNKEIATAAAVTTAMNNAGLVTDLSASSYANAFDNDNIDPISVVDKQKEVIQLATGKVPRSLLLPRPVFRGIRNNAKVKARVSGALQGIDVTRISAQQLAVAMDLDEIIIADGIVNTAAAGLAASNSFIWGKNALLFFKPKAPGLKTVAFGYMFKWMKGKMAALVYTDYSKRRHALWVEAKQYYAPQIIAAPCGYLWTNAVQ